MAEAIRAGLAQLVLVASDARPTPGLRELRAEAQRAGLPVREAPAAVLDSAGSGHQGVAARVTIPRAVGERELRSWSFGSDALVVVLDGITDPQNVGASARVAEAAGASLIVMRERRSAPVTAAAVRASAGALLHLPHARVANLSRVLEALEDRGFAVVGLDGRAEASIYEADPPGRPLALVVGSEGAGISRLVRERCDRLVRLPMGGKVASLNAAAALSAVLYAFVLPSDRG